MHAIVLAHGGSVHVTSRPGQTAFLVRLPVRGGGSRLDPGRISASDQLP